LDIPQKSQPFTDVFVTALAAADGEEYITPFTLNRRFPLSSTTSITKYFPLNILPNLLPKDSLKPPGFLVMRFPMETNTWMAFQPGHRESRRATKMLIYCCFALYGHCTMITPVPRLEFEA
jgi:hypothetical protein